MREDLVPRLQQTYDTLHATRTVSLEAEAIVSALIEELEEVNDAVDSARHPATFQQPEGDDPEAMLEAQIVELLKGLLGTSHRAHSVYSLVDTRSNRFRDRQAHSPPQSV